MAVKRYIFSYFIICLLLIVTSCSTEFEKIRTSNDPEMILKKAHEYFKDGDNYNAQALYELSIQYFRGKAEAEDIYFNFAYTYYNTSDFTTASQYFKTFCTTFLNSPKREEAYFMSAFSKYKLSPSFRLDQTPSVKAIEEFQEFINAYPNSPRIVQCNKLIDEMRAKLEQKSFNQAQQYFDMGYFESAVRSFQNHLGNFPGSSFEEEAQFLMIKSSYELASNSVIEKREERYNETVTLCNKYLEKISKKSFKNDVKQILEKSLVQLKNLGA
ncbi:MAG TPA: outer membrane protein assembly factor BamD [Saprospiraceae bacterium]|nr:outer membrane protein assembly factor BamD [Saprospiraceae bacterium]HPN71350.1 outer membrane protein assembly factor BamD [Saprospiraceae bacterium]